MAGIYMNGVTDNAMKSFSDLDQSTQILIKSAIEARKMAYCPYSNLAVGAAIQTVDGHIYTGSNVENGTYGASMCAERAAAVKAVNDGRREFEALAVVGMQDNTFSTPCGMCRQFLMEFAKTDFQVYVTKPLNPPSRVLCKSFLKLLPKVIYD